jgi:hypothetical protein
LEAEEIKQESGISNKLINLLLNKSPRTDVGGGGKFGNKFCCMVGKKDDDWWRGKLVIAFTSLSRAVIEQVGQVVNGCFADGAMGDFAGRE